MWNTKIPLVFRMAFYQDYKNKISTLLGVKNTLKNNLVILLAFQKSTLNLLRDSLVSSIEFNGIKLECTGFYYLVGTSIALRTDIKIAYSSMRRRAPVGWRMDLRSIRKVHALALARRLPQGFEGQ